jgi:LacI family transcriptional regulator
VLVNRRLHGHLSVTTHDVRGGDLAAEHLVELGHRDVGVIAGPAYASTCVERTHGFVHRFLRAGVAIPADQIMESRADAEGGYEAARELLSRNPGLTALFAINDFAAIGAMGAAREAGRVPGQDIAIIGYNDIPLARFLPQPLTSVRSPMFEMGQHAASALIGVLDGATVDSELMEPQLSVRESTASVVLAAS